MAFMPQYWGGDYYTIEKLDVSTDTIKDQTTFRLLFRKNFLLPNNSAAVCGYIQTFSNEVLHNLGEKQIMHLLAEGASKDLEYPQEFMTAMAKWWTSMEDKQEWKTLGYLTKPLSIDYMKAKYSELNYDNGGWIAPPQFTGKPSESSPVNMNDVNILPGITETVKHPKPQVDDLLPECEQKDCRIKDMIIHLNDSHRWTREQIADWLESLDVDLTFKAPEVRLKEQKQAELSIAYTALADAQKKISTYKELISALEQKVPLFEEEIKKLEEEINE